jgi:DNA invertase Pin-like site-specific DNA recombinase
LFTGRGFKFKTRFIMSRNSRAETAQNSANRKQTEITECVGYVRVSSTEQAESGLSLQAQKEKIAAQATANGWKLVGIYEDAGLSAKTLDRPGLQAAFKKLKPGRVLLVLKLDRLTRSVRDLYELTQVFEKSGGEWASIQEKFDTSSATGRLILAIMVQLSQWERETISERTTTALATKKTRRERLGTTPLGFKTEEQPDGTTLLIQDESEMATVALARELHAHDFSLRKIAAILTANGHKTKRGGKWEAATVARIIAPRYVESIAKD